MKDGHLNKCKDCCKQDAKERESKLRLNPEWVEKEKARARDKYRRLNYKEKQKDWDKNKPWKQSSKYKGLSKKFNAMKGIELHHWSYKDEHLEEVFFLPIKFHRYAHTFLTLDLDERFFIHKTGIKLDTREKHQRFLDSLMFDNVTLTD